MLLTRDHLPETISDIASLDDLLCRPSQWSDGGSIAALP